MHPTSENRGQQHSALGAGPVPPDTGVPGQHQGPQQPGCLEFQVKGVVQPQEVWPPTQRPGSGPGPDNNSVGVPISQMGKLRLGGKKITQEFVQDGTVWQPELSLSAVCFITWWLSIVGSASNIS